MNEVFVTNKNSFPHEDRFNGHLYSFPRDEKVLIPIDAARHMFGFGAPDKTEALVRLGWANPGPGDDNDAGVKKLAKFVFTQAKVVEEPVDEKAIAKESARG
jgi:hypothetical protein